MSLYKPSGAPPKPIKVNGKTPVDLKMGFGSGPKKPSQIQISCKDSRKQSCQGIWATPHSFLYLQCRFHNLHVFFPFGDASYVSFYSLTGVDAFKDFFSNSLFSLIRKCLLISLACCLQQHCSKLQSLWTHAWYIYLNEFTNKNKGATLSEKLSQDSPQRRKLHQNLNCK